MQHFFWSLLMSAQRRSVIGAGGKKASIFPEVAEKHGSKAKEWLMLALVDCEQRAEVYGGSVRHLTIKLPLWMGDPDAEANAGWQKEAAAAVFEQWKQKFEETVAEEEEKETSAHQEETGEEAEMGDRTTEQAPAAAGEGRGGAAQEERWAALIAGAVAKAKEELRTELANGPGKDEPALWKGVEENADGSWSTKEGKAKEALRQELRRMRQNGTMEHFALFETLNRFAGRSGVPLRKWMAEVDELEKVTPDAEEFNGTRALEYYLLTSADLRAEAYRRTMIYRWLRKQTENGLSDVAGARLRRWVKLYVGRCVSPSDARLGKMTRAWTTPISVVRAAFPDQLLEGAPERARRAYKKLLLAAVDPEGGLGQFAQAMEEMTREPFSAGRIAPTPVAPAAGATTTLRAMSAAPVRAAAPVPAVRSRPWVGRCLYCGQQGHYVRACPLVLCDLCNQKGHSRSGCPTRGGVRTPCPSGQGPCPPAQGNAEAGPQ